MIVALVASVIAYRFYQLAGNEEARRVRAEQVRDQEASARSAAEARAKIAEERATAAEAARQYAEQRAISAEQRNAQGQAVMNNASRNDGVARAEAAELAKLNTLRAECEQGLRLDKEAARQREESRKWGDPKLHALQAVTPNAYSFRPCTRYQEALNQRQYYETLRSR